MSKKEIMKQTKRLHGRTLLWMNCWFADARQTIPNEIKKHVVENLQEESLKDEATKFLRFIFSSLH